MGMPPTGLNQPELVLPSQPRRVETVNFHPTADCVLASTSLDTLVIWDLIQAKELVSKQCGNYRKLLSGFSRKNYVKSIHKEHHNTLWKSHQKHDYCLYTVRKNETFALTEKNSSNQLFSTFVS